MSVQAAKNVTSILIGKTGARTASVQYTDPSNATTYLFDGEILMLGEDGAVLTTPTLTTNRKIRFVQRSGNKLKFSPFVDGNNMVDSSSASYQAATEMKVDVGFVGTAGPAIDVTGTDPYKLMIRWTYDESVWSEQSEFDTYYYNWTTTPSQLDVALSMAEQINYKQLPPGRANTDGVRVRSHIFMDEAGAALSTGITGTTVNFAVTQDSDWIIADGTITGGTLAVGDYLRFDQAGSPGTLTIPVYKVKAIDTTNAKIQLSMKYQGASDPTLPIASDINFIAAATADAAECGFDIVAQELKWTLDFFKYLQCTFRVEAPIDSWSSTEVVTTDPVRPVNSGQLISEIESFTNGFEGALNRTIVPLDAGYTDADSAGTYSTIQLTWVDRSNFSAIGAAAPMEQTVILAYIVGAAQGETTMEADLATWVVTTNPPFAAATVAIP